MAITKTIKKLLIISGVMAFVLVGLPFIGMFIMAPEVALKTISSEDWKKTATRIYAPVDKIIYFYSMSEWAGDWTPVIAYEGSDGKIRKIQLSINSVSRQEATPVYFKPPSTLVIASQEVNLASDALESEATYIPYEKQDEIKTLQKIGIIQKRADGKCCWEFIGSDL